MNESYYKKKVIRKRNNVENRRSWGLNDRDRWSTEKEKTQETLNYFLWIFVCLIICVSKCMRTSVRVMNCLF